MPPKKIKETNSGKNTSLLNVKQDNCNSSVLIKKINLIKAMMGDLTKDFEHYKAEKKDSEYYIQSCLEDLNDNFRLTKELHHFIISSESDLDADALQLKDNYLTQNVFFEVRNIYLEFSDALNTALKKYKMDCKKPDEAGPINQNEIKLPRLDIKPFYGNYETWPEFYSIFKSAVHENESVSNSYKLHLLKMYVKGKAAQLLSNIHVDSSNYDDAWKILCDRFDHTRLLVKTQFQILFNQSSLVSETADGLRNLYDTTNESLVSLKNLGRNTEGWDDIVLYLMHSKLPIKTQQLWEEKIGSNKDPPKLTEFKLFLENRFRTLEALVPTKVFRNDNLNNKKKSHSNSFNTTSTTSNSSNANNCKLCRQNHSIRFCDKFKNLTVSERVNEVKRIKLCFNCLSPAHIYKQCTSKGSCFTCGKKHHTLLHLGDGPEERERTDPSQTLNSNINQPTSVIGDDSALIQNSSWNYELPSLQLKPNDQLNCNAKPFTLNSYMNSTTIVFPTALVKVKSSNGKVHVFKALIDACSDASYISDFAAQLLNLKRIKTNVTTSGLGDNPTGSSKHLVHLDIASMIVDSFTTRIKAYILPKISINRPVNSFVLNDVSFIKDLELADPTFNSSSKIDILLGADVDAIIQCGGFKRLESANLIAKETKLGWVISGQTPRMFNTLLSHQPSDTTILENLLQKFWQTEEVDDTRQLSPDDLKAENLYAANTSRRSDGKYEVSLPFNTEINPKFVNMKHIALTRYLSLERRLSNNSEQKQKYFACLQEYLDLNQMTEFKGDCKDAYFLPHHAVVKESSSTTKLRIVFDGSAKDVTGKSLNDTLLTGPRLQSDLVDILMRFRLHKIAMSADITKMYRQIWINPNNRPYQLIFYRDKISNELKIYSLDTVTFGTSAAPYLAIKTLIQAAIDHKEQYPIGAESILNGFYVDDFIYGANSIPEALKIQRELKSILNSAGLPLRKWASNCEQILENVEPADREIEFPLNFDTGSIKTLGIQWHPSQDYFTLNIELPERSSFNKRNVLSDIARLYDPLGWVSPCIISAKLLMQLLWLKQRDWDEPLDNEIAEKWVQLRSDFLKLKLLRIPRWIRFQPQADIIQLHGFCDASQKAYAAVVYIRVILNNKVEVNLVVSKTKVAPLKKVTLPRLELCAAVLLSKLLKRVRQILNIEENNLYFYTDSTIVLAWIQGDPNKRTTYVSNRITTIQSLSRPNQWNHVRTEENPADYGTRGKRAEDLLNNSFWWQGPSFLSNANDHRESVQLEETNEEVAEELTPGVMETNLSSIIPNQFNLIMLS